MFNSCNYDFVKVHSQRIPLIADSHKSPVGDHMLILNVVSMVNVMVVVSWVGLISPHLMVFIHNLRLCSTFWKNVK
jgi:hypothetical protein